MCLASRCISLARDLPEVVDTVAEAEKASQGAQIDHLAIAVKKGVGYTSSCRRRPRNLPEIVDYRRNAQVP